MKKRAAIYTRTATSEGAAAKLAAQEETCQAYAEEQGWVVDLIVQENGFSGSQLDRPGLGRLREAAATGEIEIVLVQHPDRLTRSLGGWQQLRDEMGRYGVEIRTVIGG